MEGKKKRRKGCWKLTERMKERAIVRIRMKKWTKEEMEEDTEGENDNGTFLSPHPSIPPPCSSNHQLQTQKPTHPRSRFTPSLSPLITTPTISKNTQQPTKNLHLHPFQQPNQSSHHAFKNFKNRRSRHPNPPTKRRILLNSTLQRCWRSCEG